MEIFVAKMESFVARMFAGNIILANKMNRNFSICLALLFTAYLIHENLESFVAKMESFVARMFAGNIILANKMNFSICLALLFTAFIAHEMESLKEETVFALLTLPYIPTYLVTHLTLLDSYIVVPPGAVHDIASIQEL